MLKKQIEIADCRTATLIQKDQTVQYSQGFTTAVCTLLANPEFSNVKTIKTEYYLNYNVALTADIVNYEIYRTNRRHYQIQRFVNLAYNLASPSLSLALRVLSTDGSSRCVAVNSMIKHFKDVNCKKIACAISFGLYEQQLVYDLNYLADSAGQGDCAIMFCIDRGAQINLVASILYEGLMNITQFKEGLVTARQRAMDLLNRI